jgi:hypothetical protein
MRKLVLKCSRKLLGWPPVAATFEQKAELIRRYRNQFDLAVFVETGTFKAEMIEAQHDCFQKLISIELSPQLHAAARAKFSQDAKVELYQGDSGVKLAEAVKNINGPALFWLDAHYSMGITAGRHHEAPIIKELSCLVHRKQARDVILIDDARLFGWDFGYPRLKVIQTFVEKHWPEHSFSVQSDVICILPA